MKATRTCSVDECERPAKGKRDWCAMHTERWRRWGDPTETRPRVRGICAESGCNRPGPGTQVENMEDRRTTGAGYARGGESPTAVQVSPEVVAAIRAEYQPHVKGRGQHAVAQRFGLSRTTVQRIVTESDRWGKTA